MTEEEFKNLVIRADEGTALIGIDRALARKFYTIFPLSQIKRDMGEAPYMEKAIIIALYFLGWGSLIMNSILAPIVFKWWSVAIVPSTVIVYVIFIGDSSLPNRGWLILTLIMMFTIVLLIFNVFTTIYHGLFVVSLVLAFWAGRLVYVAATYFLRAFVLRNRKAFECVRPQVRFLT